MLRKSVQIVEYEIRCFVLLHSSLLTEKQRRHRRYACSRLFRQQRTRGRFGLKIYSLFLPPLPLPLSCSPTNWAPFTLCSVLCMQIVDIVTAWCELKYRTSAVTGNCRLYRLIPDDSCLYLIPRWLGRKAPCHNHS